MVAPRGHHATSSGGGRGTWWPGPPSTCWGRALFSGLRDLGSCVHVLTTPQPGNAGTCHSVDRSRTPGGGQTPWAAAGRVLGGGSRRSRAEGHGRGQNPGHPAPAWTRPGPTPRNRGRWPGRAWSPRPASAPWGLCQDSGERPSCSLPSVRHLSSQLVWPRFPPCNIHAVPGPRAKPLQTPVSDSSAAGTRMGFGRGGYAQPRPGQ